MANGFTNVMGKDGSWSTINDKLLDEYKSKGYTTDLKAQIDYNNLPSNSIYRTENQNLVGNAYAPPVNIVNAPSDYKPLANTNSIQQQQQQQQQPQYDLTSKMQELKNAQISNSIAELNQSKNNSMAAINTEKAQIAPQYQGQRNVVATQSDIKVKNLAEYMANRGSLGAGGNNQIRTSMETAGLNNQSNLYRQEQSALDDIARRITGVEQDYNTGVQQAQSGADVQFIQNTLAELGRLRDYGREDLQNAFSNNLALQEANNNQAITNANLKDKATAAMEREVEVLIAANYNDISALRNKIQAANPNDPRLPYIQAAINQKVADQKAAQAAAGTAAQKAAYDSAFNTWKELGYATPQIAAILGVPVNAKTASYNIDKMQVAVSQQNANTSARNAAVNEGQLAWSKDSTNPNNISKLNTSTTNTVDDYSNTIKSLYITTPNSDNGYRAKQDTAGIQTYLDSLLAAGVSESIVDSLAARFGIN